MLSALRMASTLNKECRSSNARLPGNSGFFLRGSPRRPAGASTAALGAYPSTAGDMRAMLQLAGEKIPTERGGVIHRRRQRPTPSSRRTASPRLSRDQASQRGHTQTPWMSIPDLPSRSSAHTPGVRNFGHPPTRHSAQVNLNCLPKVVFALLPPKPDKPSTRPCRLAIGIQNG